jgi:prophage regulatory protein
MTDNETPGHITLDEVIERTGMSRSAIYRMVKAETFPKPTRFGTRKVRWVEREVDEWVSDAPYRGKSNVEPLDDNAPSPQAGWQKARRLANIIHRIALSIPTDVYLRAMGGSCECKACAQLREIDRELKEMGIDPRGPLSFYQN